MSGTLREGSATEAGLSAKQLDVARDLAAQFVKDGILPALVVLVARHGVIALHEAFGVLGPEPDDPPLPRDAIFLLASLTKPVTATALMALVEDGRVGLTRPVREYIPEFDGDGKDKVYVHHLLTHTSGLMSFGDIDELVADLSRRLQEPPRDPTIDRSLDASLQIAYEHSLRKSPGEEMFYDSLNYDLLGEIVRRVSGRSLPDFVNERVFAPLGMRDSSVGLPRERRVSAVRAVAEGRSAAGWSLPFWNTALGAGSVYSTALDMASFGQAFLDGGGGPNGRILAPATVREMITNQIPGIPGVLFEEAHGEASWGYGWGIVCHEKWAYFPTHPAGTFQHGGSTGVYLWCDPTHDLVGAFFGAAVKEIVPDQLWWNADLFVNAVTAAIED